MPCESCGSPRTYKPELDKVTRLLCSTLRNLRRGSNTAFCELLDNDSELSEWWEEHQANDRRRAAEAAEKRRAKQEAEEAYAKLTPRQRKILGVQAP